MEQNYVSERMIYEKIVPKETKTEKKSSAVKEDGAHETLPSNLPPCWNVFFEFIMSVTCLSLIKRGRESNHSSHKTVKV